MRLALQTQTPIVPVSVIGAEEQLGRRPERLKLLGMPALPVIPNIVGGFMPLPSKYRPLRKPARFAGDPDDDDAVIDPWYNGFGSHSGDDPRTYRGSMSSIKSRGREPQQSFCRTTF